MLHARTALVVYAALILTACRDITPPERPSFTVVPLWPDTVGICLGAGSPSGSYTFSWTIQNGQPGDILQDLSPTTANLNPGECLLPWRRTTPLPAGIFVTVIVTEVAAPAAVGLDSVEVQDRYGDHVYLSATDTAQVDTVTGGALTFYHHQLGTLLQPHFMVFMPPIPGPDPSRATGRVRVSLDLFLPPNPCGPVGAGAGSGVALCGVIHNPGLETFTRGVLSVNGMEFSFGETALPPGPCRQYHVQGAVPLPAGLITQLAEDPSRLGLRFESREHPDGAIGGSPAREAGRTVAAAVAVAGETGACTVRFGS